MKILMVCLGNICRSPLAEGILKKKIKENCIDWIVDSAGTESYHVGEKPHPLAQKIAFSHGVDISAHQARRFTVTDLDTFDKIYALSEDVYDEIKQMAGKNPSLKKVDLLLNEVHPGENLSVPDPWYGGEKDFIYAYRLIEEACAQIISGRKINTTTDFVRN